MKYADLHCDTPFRLYKNNASLLNNDLHISLNKASCFEKYVQVAAIWSDYSLNDEDCYKKFFEIYDHFSAEAKNTIVKSSIALKNNKNSFLLAIEDIRLISNNLKKIYTFYDLGVRIATLTWRDISIIGGAWNTNTGLTDFGRECVETMLDIGIIPDVSHGSDRLLRDTAEIVKCKGKTFCATHSNSRSVYDIPRNLSDENAKIIADLGGVIGLSLYPNHISSNIDNFGLLMHHIDHYLVLIGENSLCLGCDLDGVDSLPIGFSNITNIEKIYHLITKKYNENIAEKILFTNAYNFLLNNI